MELVHMNPQRRREVGDEAGQIICEMERPIATCLAEAGTIMALAREAELPAHVVWLCEDLEARLAGIQHQHNQLVTQYAIGR